PIAQGLRHAGERIPEIGDRTVGLLHAVDEQGGRLLHRRIAARRVRAHLSIHDGRWFLSPWCLAYTPPGRDMPWRGVRPREGVLGSQALYVLFNLPQPHQPLLALNVRTCSLNFAATFCSVSTASLC